ncbi:hypothetical protein IJU97_06585 [bacterium]|nr:hypothetical protein [bacterium]
MFFNYFQQGLENSLEKYNAYMSGDYTLEDLSLDADAAKIFSINVDVNEDAAESVSEPEVAEADVIFNDDTEAENIDNIIDEV